MEKFLKFLAFAWGFIIVLAIMVAATDNDATTGRDVSTISDNATEVVNDNNTEQTSAISPSPSVKNEKIKESDFILMAKSYRFSNGHPNMGILADRVIKSPKWTYKKSGDLNVVSLAGDVSHKTNLHKNVVIQFDVLNYGGINNIAIIADGNTLSIYDTILFIGFLYYKAGYSDLMKKLEREIDPSEWFEHGNKEILAKTRENYSFSTDISSSNFIKLAKGYQVGSIYPTFEEAAKRTMKSIKWNYQKLGDINEVVLTGKVLDPTGNFDWSRIPAIIRFDFSNDGQFLDFSVNLYESEMQRDECNAFLLYFLTEGSGK